MLSNYQKLTAFFLCICSLSMFAQKNITNIEYFFDADPGIEKATGLSINLANNTKTLLDIPTPSNMPTGLHTLYVRVKSDNGVWSHPKPYLFMISNEVNQIDKVEYYIDEDPGIGNGVNLNFTKGATLNETLTITTSNALTFGLHTLYLRIKQTGGNWSHPKPYLFFKAKETDLITGAEFFIDEDPGIGKGSSLAVSNGATINQTITIPTSNNIETGLHTLYVRVKEGTDEWSMASAYLFYVSNEPINDDSPIINAEYFIDDFVKVGEATKIALSETGSRVNTSFEVTNTGELSQGEHNLFVRVQNEAGIWSLLDSFTFTVQGVLSTPFEEIQKVNFYPNPTTGAINISFGNEGFKGKYELYDGIGRLLRTKQILKTSQLKENINQKSGIYFIRLLDEQKRVKFIKIIKK